MLVPRLGTKLIQGLLQIEEVIRVWATWTVASRYEFGKGLGFLGTSKLVIAGSSNVDQGSDGSGAVSRVKRFVVYRVAVDLTDIKIILYLSNMLLLDPIGRAPDPIWGAAMVVGELFPIAFFDQGYNTTGSLRGSTVVLAVDFVSTRQPFGLFLNS
jgi:hypothetical protein